MGYGEGGGKTALPIWIDYMAAAIQKYGAPEFPVPEGISHVMINKATGKPLDSGAQNGFMESYVTGFDQTSTPQGFDAEGKPASSTIDDDEYFMNQ